MISRSTRKAHNGQKPLASLLPISSPAPSPIPSVSNLVLTPIQPRFPPTGQAAAPTTQSPPMDEKIIGNYEAELAALRSGTHPGFLRALDRLDTTQSESILSVQRLREERLRNVDEMYIAEMKAIEDEYRAAAEEIREKMIEELITKNADSKAPKPLDMVTRKRAKMSGGHKEERPKKRTNIKGMRYSLTSDEIASDLETVRARMAGLSGSTRSKTKTAH